MNTAPPPVYEWKDLPWRTIQREVFKLQKRIYRASQRNDRPLVHKLQRLLMASWSARCLAVRHVTQDNRGKRTAGVDGVKRLTPPQRLALVEALRHLPHPQPTRRVWIDKPGTTEQRPLGIPTIRDRAAQALVKLALEPEWEAKFEPHSYGFRPGRSCHDAIEALFSSLHDKAKYVLDADIAHCFDRISHQALLTKLQTFPALARIIRAWLTAGVLDGQTLFPTEAGTPQGGVLSPLLANIALHGLETHITAAYPTEQCGIAWKPQVIRYADDFVALHPDKEVISEIRERVNAWLAKMGLELKPSKTRITHTLNAADGTPGFDFLGFTIRHHPVGKCHTGKTTRGRPLGFKTIIKPSTDAVSRHNRSIAAIVRQYRTAPQAALIARLNPIIRGWSRYYSTVVAKKLFDKLDHEMWCRLRRWATRRHPRKAMRWVVRKYWRRDRGSWDFGGKTGPQLRNYAKTPIRRHTKVSGAKSYYDGDWVYWASRLGNHPQVPAWIARTLKQQGGKCAWCGLHLTLEDLYELDHRRPTAQGGTHRWTNWQIIHGHCHDTKTAQDRIGAVEVPADKGHVVEEPDEPKGSCPVLKAGEGR